MHIEQPEWCRRLLYVGQLAAEECLSIVRSRVSKRAGHVVPIRDGFRQLLRVTLQQRRDLVAHDPARHAIMSDVMKLKNHVVATVAWILGSSQPQQRRKTQIERVAPQIDPVVNLLSELARGDQFYFFDRQDCAAVDDLYWLRQLFP